MQMVVIRQINPNSKDEVKIALDLYPDVNATGRQKFWVYVDSIAWMANIPRITVDNK